MSQLSRLVSTLHAAPSLPTKPGPCFRTDAEGRIALTQDWAKLFSEARRFDSLALQTRHTYVRLIHIEKLPVFDWVADRASAGSSTGSVRLNPSTWSHACGRLAECECCGTPGRMEIYNAHGLDFLQLCALPGCAPNAWADYLLDTFARGKNPPTASIKAHADFPSTPTSCVTVGDASADEMLPDFITALSDSELPFSAVLQTPEIVHVREMHAHRVLLNGPLLTVQAPQTTLQIGLPAVRQLAVGISAVHGPQLHLLGADQTLLLTLSASTNPGDSVRWQAALRRAFPTSD